MPLKETETMFFIDNDLLKLLEAEVENRNHLNKHQTLNEILREALEAKAAA